MKFNEFPELTDIGDDDILLIQEANSLGIKKIKLAALKQYIGVTTGTPEPINPPTGYSKYYRMDDIATSGTTIITVTDKASGNNLTSLTGNPILINNAINGKNVANFNNCAMKHNPETYIAKHAFIVYRNNIQIYNDYNAYIAARKFDSDKLAASNEMFIISGSRNTSNIYGESSTKAYIDSVEQNINQFKDYSQGVNAGVAGKFHIVESVFGNSASGTKNLCVGADNNSSGRYLQNTDIAEIIIYPFELSSQQRNSIYSYFKSYYNFDFL